MLSNLLSFAVLAGLLTMLPGLDTAQVLRSVTVGGSKSAYATVAGILTGVWIWGLAAALGISALLVASHFAHTAVKWAGAIYWACIYSSINPMNSCSSMFDASGERITYRMRSRKCW